MARGRGGGSSKNRVKVRERWLERVTIEYVLTLDQDGYKEVKNALQGKAYEAVVEENAGLRIWENILENKSISWLNETTGRT